MRQIYIHQHPDWPRFHWQTEELADSLAEARHRQGRLIGRMESLGFQLRQEAVLETLTGDVVKTSEIEGEILDPREVRSSLAWRLGLDGGVPAADRNIEGIVEVMLDATQNYTQPLTDERLFGWHAALFPTGRSGGYGITIGSYRTNTVQVISGPMGRQRVHFEAPPAPLVEQEMRMFLDWYNSPSDTDDVINAALAHLWFVTIHPFDDGNGRIARAIADMTLARSEGSSQRFYSMSSQIRRERRGYYGILERTQAKTMNVTPWMVWFVGCLSRAIENSEATVDATLAKAHFWGRIAEVPTNERQRKMLNLLLGDFKGNLTTLKWAKITKCSHDTALRDINALLEHGILARSAQGGRSTNYSLVIDP